MRRRLREPLTMLKFLSKVKLDFNASDPRVASCLEFLAQCNARKARESNPACQLLVKRRLDDRPPTIGLTFVDGAEEAIDASATPAQTIRELIREKGRLLASQKLFREAGEPWPVVVARGPRTVIQKDVKDMKPFSRGAELRVRVTSFARFVEPSVDKQGHTNRKKVESGIA